MAKSTGLFAGADSSLVAAASRAGQFMGPPDYSKTFQAVADSYDKTMQAQAEMWGNIAMSAATIGKEIKNNTDVEPPEGGEFAQEELERASDLYKQSYGLQKTDDDKRLWPGSKEAKALRKEADKIRNEIDAYAKHNLPVINNIESKTSLIVENQKQGCNAGTMTGLHALESSNMLSASRRNKKTDHGNYYKTEIVDGKRVLVAYHDSSAVLNTDQIQGVPFAGTSKGVTTDKDGRILDTNGNIITTTPGEILSNLHINDLNKSGQDILKVNKNNTAKLLQDMGFKSKTAFGVDKYQMNQINDLINAESKDRRNWFTPGYGDENGRSFYNRITNADNQGPSTLSAKLYNSLAQITGKETSLGIKAEGVLAGFDDPNNDGHITKEEFQTTDNMKRLSLALFETGNPNYKKEVTESLYKMDQMEQYGNLFTNGHGKRGGNNKGDKFESMQLNKFFAEGQDGVDGSWMSKEDVKNMRTFEDKIRNKEEIPSTDGTFTWNEEGYYEFNGLIVPNKQALFSMYFKKKLNPELVAKSTWYNKIPDWDATDNEKYLEQRKKNKKTEKKSEGGGAVKIDNEVVKAVRLHWSHWNKSNVKKMDGAWYKEVPDGYTGNKKWIQITDDSIVERINEQYL